MTKDEARKAVERIPDEELKRMMQKGGFLASIEFSELRTIGKPSTMDIKSHTIVISEMKKIVNVHDMSDEDALRLAYALTEREMHLGYGTP